MNLSCAVNTTVKHKENMTTSVQIQSNKTIIIFNLKSDFERAILENNCQVESNSVALTNEYYYQFVHKDHDRISYLESSSMLKRSLNTALMPQMSSIDIKHEYSNNTVVLLDAHCQDFNTNCWFLQLCAGRKLTTVTTVMFFETTR